MRYSSKEMIPNAQDLKDIFLFVAYERETQSAALIARDSNFFLGVIFSGVLGTFNRRHLNAHTFID